MKCLVAALLMLACVLVWGQHSDPPKYQSASSCSHATANTQCGPSAVKSNCHNVPVTKECVTPCSKNTAACTPANCASRNEWDGVYHFHRRENSMLSTQYLCQLGNKIYGQYDGAGLIWGTVSGNTVTGRYYEAGGYYGDFMWTTHDGGQTATGSSFWGDFENVNTQSLPYSWNLHKISSARPTNDECMFSPNPRVSLNGIAQGDSYYSQQYLSENVFFMSYKGINGSELGDYGIQIGITPDGYRYVGIVDDYNYALNPPVLSHYLTAGYIDDEGNSVENDWTIDFAVGPYYTDGVFEGTYSLPFISPYSCYEVARGLTPEFQERIACYYILNATIDDSCFCNRLLQLPVVNGVW